MITMALVLHLWHMVAEGGNDTPSPVTAMSSWCGAPLASAGASLSSGFFFERFSS